MKYRAAFVATSIVAKALLAPATAWALDASMLAGDWLAPAEDANDVEAVITLAPKGDTWIGYIKAIRETRPDQIWHDGTPCTHCPGATKRHLLKGLQVIWDLREQRGTWVSGRMLDPSDGQVYDCAIALSDDTKTIKVTAYKGLKLFGRTLIWQRP